MLPAPEGVWGMPGDMLATLPGYGPDVQKNREEARKIMQSLGYGPDKHLALNISARNLPDYRDASSLILDQLNRSISTPSSTWSKPRTGYRGWCVRARSIHSAHFRGAPGQ